MGYRVRATVGADWQRYRELRLAALRDPVAPIAFFEPYEEARALVEADWAYRAEPRVRRSTFIGEDEGGRWGGMVSVFLTDADYAQVVGVYVLPECRGSGLAEGLMRAAIGWAGERDVRLHVHEGNERAARFYESLGFRPTGFSEPDPNEPGARAYELMLPLAYPRAVSLSGHGVRLREWTDDDRPAMGKLFSDPDTDRWTPLPVPFDSQEGRDYLDKVRRERELGRQVQLAITADGPEPRGTVLLFRDSVDRYAVELAYVVGAAHRRQGLATAALRVLTDFAFRRLAVRNACLRIEPANKASQGVARAAGFRPVEGGEPVNRMLKGRTVRLETWRYTS